MDADPEGLYRFLEPIKHRIGRLVYEAGPTGYSLVRYLRQQGIPADVTAPGSIPRPATKETKTDRIDCVKLAEYASKDLLKYVSVPNEQEDFDRQLIRLREKTMQSVAKVKTRIKSFLLHNGIEEPEGLVYWTKASVHELTQLALPDDLRFMLDVLLEELSDAQKRLKQLDERIRTLEKSERYAEKSKKLRRISGVGILTVMTVLTELVHPHRFQQEGEVAKMCGLAPRISQSGGTLRNCGLSYSGNRHLRRVLIEAAWRWIGGDASARSKYERLRRNTGSGKKAIVGVARKLIIIMWRMITRGEAYRAGI